MLGEYWIDNETTAKNDVAHAKFNQIEGLRQRNNTRLAELLPAALHTVERYANNPVEADHGRLKAWLRPMRGLNATASSARWPLQRPGRLASSIASGPP